LRFIPAMVVPHDLLQSDLMRGVDIEQFVEMKDSDQLCAVGRQPAKYELAVASPEPILFPYRSLTRPQFRATFVRF
jgi:hypothetical protein